MFEHIEQHDRFCRSWLDGPWLMKVVEMDIR
jgi:hypothetical protein